MACGFFPESLTEDSIVTKTFKFVAVAIFCFASLAKAQTTQLVTLEVHSVGFPSSYPISTNQSVQVVNYGFQRSTSTGGSAGMPSPQIWYNDTAGNSILIVFMC